MDYTVFSSENFQPSRWSGGSTTELYIYPLSSAYQKRNFSFRLSIATIEIDSSDFSSLSGISRKLMVLEGKTTLIHKNHYSKLLSKFEMDEFEGDWETSSIGKCTDFNLMTNATTKGTLIGKTIKKEETINYYHRENGDWVFIYLYSGKVSIRWDEKMLILNKGDLLAISKLKFICFKLKGVEYCELVISEIIL